MSPCRQIVLASRPKGAPTSSNFRLEEGPIPVAERGQVLVRTHYLSLDPYMRSQMNAAGSHPIEIGATIDGEGIAEIVQSTNPAYRPGELVLAMTGWRTHAAVDASCLRRVDSRQTPVTTALGVLGMPGFAAYAGTKLIGQPTDGETVVVAAASGPVGSLVGQLARLAGARAVGIAGGAEKCGYVRDALGFDAVVDRRAGGFPQAMARACPDGIDVYFESVGGPVWQAVLPLLNRYARVPVCGLIALYNGVPRSNRDMLPATMMTIVRRSILVQGYVNTEFVADHYCDFLCEVGPLVASGRVRYREDIVEGLEAAPEAFIGMLSGRNFGKLLVRVG
jgi:NADPH-dependent curcumin reductase CurA